MNKQVEEILKIAILQKIDSDALIIEAEFVEECGEYGNWSLFGQSPEDLREAAKILREEGK